jgi:hypothetical protein
MGLAARRGAAFAGEVAGVAAAISPIARLAIPAAPTIAELELLEAHPDRIEVLDRRDPTGGNRVTARSTSELLRRYAGGSVADGPALAIAVAWSLSLSWQRALLAQQSPVAVIEYAMQTVQDSAADRPAVRVVLGRMGQVVGSSSREARSRVGEQLAAEAARFATDVAARQHSAADQAARRWPGTTDEPCDILLLGDGSRLAGGGVATTTSVARILKEAGRVGEVLVVRDDGDPMAAEWMAADLIGAGIPCTTWPAAETLGLLAGRGTLRALLATDSGSPEYGVAVPTGCAFAIEAHSDRVLAVVSAFGDRGNRPDVRPDGDGGRIPVVVG